ncbi:MAG: hypothetical protein AB7U73_17930 [Pirellulales bacterium]
MNNSRRRASHSETELIQDEMVAIQAAIKEELAHLPRDLRAATDVRALTRRFPWAAVGLAAGLAFASASLARPASKGAAPAPTNPDAPATCEAAQGTSPRANQARTSGFLAILTGLLATVLRAAMPLVVQWLRPVAR